MLLLVLPACMLFGSCVPSCEEHSWVMYRPTPQDAAALSGLSVRATRLPMHTTNHKAEQQCTASDPSLPSLRICFPPTGPTPQIGGVNHMPSLPAIQALQSPLAQSAIVIRW